jgi:hypothetical protein
MIMLRIIKSRKTGPAFRNLRNLRHLRDRLATVQINSAFLLRKQKLSIDRRRPGPPFPTPDDLVIHNINIVSSVNGQTGGGPLFNGLPTTGFGCGTCSTPPCTWQPTLPARTTRCRSLLSRRNLRRNRSQRHHHRP